MRINQKVRISSPAKINVHLEIHGIRSDGFHDLRSLFVMTSLCDTIEAAVTAPGSGFSLSGAFSCSIEKNLIFKACRFFCETTCLPDDISITAIKNIPEGAGLGGGSGNAASVLILLNRLFSNVLPEEEIFRLGASLGSDVPFFLKSPAAIVEGRGELVFPVASRNDYFLLLCLPDIHIDTATAYSWFDSDQKGNTESTSLSLQEIDALYRKKKPEFWHFYNSFYPVISERFSEYGTINTVLRENGAVFSVLSGSGACFVGVFPDNASCIYAKQKLEEINIRAETAVPLTVLPEPEFL